MFQVPSLQWKEVVYHLDHPGFQVKDRTALRLLTQALRLGLQLQGVGADSFPVQVLYRVWKNADSQVRDAPGRWEGLRGMWVMVEEGGERLVGIGIRKAERLREVCNGTGIAFLWIVYGQENGIE